VFLVLVLPTRRTKIQRELLLLDVLIMPDFQVCYGVADTMTSNATFLTYDNEKNDVLVNVLYTSLTLLTLLNLAV